MIKTDFDAIVVGAGPNGLAAAITLQRAGINVLLLEGKDTIGGGMRTAEITLPGFKHDICSAIHPMVLASPFFKTIPLQEHGLELIHPPIAAAHPFDDGSAAILTTAVEQTAKLLGEDEYSYNRLFQPLARDWQALSSDLLGPLNIRANPLPMARFGLNGLTSAKFLSRKFKTKKARGLWAGMAAHSIQPLSNLATSAVAMILLTTGHVNGWPLAKGGSQSIADALASYFISIGGIIETGFYVKSLKQLPFSKAIVLDVTPKQLLQIAGPKFSSVYKWQLNRYKYGMGVFKVDWALDDRIPFTANECHSAGTIHVGNTLEEIVETEKKTSQGIHADKPFVLLAQQSVFDPSRAPEGKHTAWAYCHVPHGSQRNMTDAIENQVERFAPGFKERIIGRHVMNASQMEDYNPNYVGGDINGGVLDIAQLFTRPALRWSPYRTSAKGLYICSSSTPPGGGVHGMCGYHAAKRALKDVWNL